MNTTTTMNTGAASLSDERERAAITACALMIKGICLTRPNAEWTGAIEDRIQFMLKQMQAGAAIAAGGAQEAVNLTRYQWLRRRAVMVDYSDETVTKLTLLKDEGPTGEFLDDWIDGEIAAENNGETA